MAHTKPATSSPVSGWHKYSLVCLVRSNPFAWISACNKGTSVRHSGSTHETVSNEDQANQIPLLSIPTEIAPLPSRRFEPEPEPTLRSQSCVFISASQTNMHKPYAHTRTQVNCRCSGCLGVPTLPGIRSVMGAFVYVCGGVCV